MKKILFYALAFSTILISGCFDTVQETTINDNGAGIFTNTTDMGSMFKMIKMMGGDESKEIDKLKVDTIFSLAAYKDSVSGLTGNEIKLLENATLKTLMNAADEKLQMTFTFPFSDPSDIISINSVIKKTRDKAIGSLMGKMIPDEGTAGNQLGEDGNTSPDINDYFTNSFASGKISNKINKAKYADAGNDKALKSLQEMSQMGMPMTMKTIINLPRPASKTNGKGLSLSPDKKKITIEGTIDDFFDNPEKFEYEIDY